ncbi:MAG: TonB family protein [Terriglobales bacterium]
MAPRALLLSPDDQAVSAITGVLEELSVNCERPLDGSSAAQKLNSQSFDLVLVDCDNLPAAKLIFDVCRRTRAGVSIPIAIVDGRAGLPTAFRLGAELILTKPVAKDQARSTIRTAVNRLRKEEPARATQPVEPASAEAAAPAVPEKFAQAAAAVGSVSLQAKTVEASAPVESPVTALAAVPVLSEPVMPEPVISEPAMPALVTPQMSSAAADAAIAPDAVEPAPAPSAMISSATRGRSPSSLPAPPRQPSDDPVLAELERAETEPERAIFSSYAKPQKSKPRHGLLVAALLVGLAGGGFYAAWMYAPGFRELVQVQLGRVMALAGMANQLMGSGAHPQTASRPPVKAVTPQAPPAAPRASASSTLPASADTSSPARTPAESIAVPAAAAAAAPAKTELAGESDAVILSSKGAERRLVHRVEPAYPPEVRSQGVEGTVVLKTTVNESGTVERVRLVEGNPAMAEPAISAVKQWRYKPYVRDGKAQPFQTIVLVDVP